MDMGGIRMKTRTENAAFIDACQKVANEVVELLREKNLSYGNSLQHPIGIFAPGDDRTRHCFLSHTDAIRGMSGRGMSSSGQQNAICCISLRQVQRHR